MIAAFDIIKLKKLLKILLRRNLYADIYSGKFKAAP